MARCRIIKPEFWDDEKLSLLSFQARLTYIGIWNFCDDYGVTKANSLWLKSRIFPFDDRLSLKEFEKWLSELIEIKRVLKFSENGNSYFYLPKFKKHQVINRPSKTRYPEYHKNLLESSRSPHGVLTDEIEVEVEIEREVENNLCARAREAEGSVSDFGRFWQAYPKRVGKTTSEKAWKASSKKRPTIETILQKIEQLKKSSQWQKDGGQYIPNPATWINRGGWDDEVKVSTAGECPGFDWSKE